MAELLTDQQLLLAFQNGESGAFTDIYNKYQAELYIHALKMLKDADLATDAVHDVFMILLTGKSPLNRVHHLGQFLHGCMRHQIISTLRKNKSWENYLAKFMEGPQESTELSMVEIWHKLEDEQQRLQQLIEKEIAALPPKMRRAFELAHKANMSHKEIAEITGTAKETVKKNIKYALGILRRKLLVWLF